MVMFSPCICPKCGATHEEGSSPPKVKLYRWVVKNYHNVLGITDEYYDENCKQVSYYKGEDTGISSIAPSSLPIQRIESTMIEVEAEEYPK